MRYMWHRYTYEFDLHSFFSAYPGPKNSCFENFVSNNLGTNCRIQCPLNFSYVSSIDNKIADKLRLLYCLIYLSSVLSTVYLITDIIKTIMILVHFSYMLRLLKEPTACGLFHNFIFLLSFLLYFRKFKLHKFHSTFYCLLSVVITI